MEHESPRRKSVVLVKCDSGFNSTDSEVVRLTKRSPQDFDNFQEEDVEITGEVTGRAPIPQLIVGVRQNSD